MDDHGNPRPASRVDLDDPATYLRIKRIASRFVRPQLNPTLNATAFAAEVWIKLKGSRSALRVRDETHLDALVGQAARYVANSWARGRLSLKRRGIRVTDADLDRQTAREVSLDTVLQMNESLAELEKEDAKTAAILRDVYFEGLTVAEISANREISERTVERTLTLGRAWIHDWLTRNPDDSRNQT